MRWGEDKEEFVPRLCFAERERETRQVAFAAEAVCDQTSTHRPTDPTTGQWSYLQLLPPPTPPKTGGGDWGGGRLREGVLAQRSNPDLGITGPLVYCKNKFKGIKCFYKGGYTYVWDSTSFIDFPLPPFPSLPHFLPSFLYPIFDATSLPPLPAPPSIPFRTLALRQLTQPERRREQNDEVEEFSVSRSPLGGLTMLGWKEGAKNRKFVRRRRKEG